MNSLRNLSRLLSLTRSHLLTKSVQIPKLLDKNVPAIQQTFTRGYAKGKDKKKDNKTKKNIKVEINEHLLSSMINLEALNTQYQKTVDQMRDEFIKNLSLRSTTGSIETLRVSVDGKEHELQEIAQIVRKNPKTIVVNMISFPQAIQATLTALAKSGMNLNPQQDGTTIFIPVPKVTREHRENLAKNAKTLFVKCKDTIRDVQMTHIKKVKKQTEVSQDDQFSVQNQITAIADGFISQAEKLLETKTNELIGGKD